MKPSILSVILAVFLGSMLVACGGSNSVPPQAATAPVLSLAPASSSTKEVLTRQEASRFLAQATFGPTEPTIEQLVGSGPDSWFNTQFSSPRVSHLGYLNELQKNMLLGQPLSTMNFYESFWKQGVTGDDQLRQRMAFALSQIFVISYKDSNVASYQKGAADYYDTLGNCAFGNFRDLLQSIARHPIMGLYLSHMRNQKEDGARLPDENFARELMQLFTIGLYELNQDGTPKLVDGKPIETYTGADVSGLAKVFTGWGWAGPDQARSRWWGGLVATEREYTPMQMYPVFHSTSEKKFLGVTIPPNGTGEADLKIALDTLFNHPNVGPFIGKQLIQRLVSSNPSPQYVGRVAAAFANNGNGVRGDMKAVIKAILMDPEARDTNSAGEGMGHKVREPVLRLAGWMRAFNVKSGSGRFRVGVLDDPATALAQTPMGSPSVFNFYRPGYVPPESDLGAAGLVAPEMQITSEMAVIGYLNFMRNTIAAGIGVDIDIKPDYGPEIELASTPDKLLDRIELKLLGRPMSPTLRGEILAAVSSVALPAPTATNAAAIADSKRNRVCLAIFLTMASAEYIVQK